MTRQIDLKRYQQHFSEYTELRAQENKDISIALNKGNLTDNSRHASSGVSARVYKSGAWGFASYPELNDEAIASAVRSATQNAVFLDGKIRRQKPALPSVPATASHDFSTQKARLSQKYLIDFMRALDDYIVSKYPALSSRGLRLISRDMEKSLLTSDGSASFSLIPIAHIMIRLSVEKDGQTIDLHDKIGQRASHFEDVFQQPSDIFPTIDRLYQKLMDKKEGTHAKAGTVECVLDAELAGVLAHEAIGHTTEADFVLGGSVAGDYLGKPVASPLVSLVDFAHSYDGAICPMPIYIDDEGTLANDAVIIENGILKGFMHNKESAAHFGVPPTGNARGYTFSDEPIIRMRNTAFLPGQSSLQDMIASVDDGYYLIRFNNGQADTTSEFMFGITLGYEIKKGTIGRAIKNTTISGVAFDMLKTVTMVSRDMKWTNAGMCGKKQLIPVGMGGPALKCKINIGGR